MKISIKFTKHGHGGRVFIDDHEIHSVKSVSFSASVGQANYLKLELLPSEIDIECPVKIDND